MKTLKSYMLILLVISLTMVTQPFVIADNSEEQSSQSLVFADLYSALRNGIDRESAESIIGTPPIFTTAINSSELECLYYIRISDEDALANITKGVTLKIVYHNNILIKKNYTIQWLEGEKIIQFTEEQSIKSDIPGKADPPAPPAFKTDGTPVDILKHTYCNPLPIPDYPRGNGSKDRRWEGEQDYLHWVKLPKADFRETADPSVIYHEGKWYLYSSCGMAYYTEDFVNWKHVRLEPYDIGYAPTVVKWKNKFLLTACLAKLWEADNPLGPFREIGPMLDYDGKPLEEWKDPMLFADDDGSLYAYWGLGGKGLKGAPLKLDEPNRLAAPAKYLAAFNSNHEWERYGAFNEHKYRSYCEGSWMFKYRGKYYLTYAAPGTEFRTYGMGAYVSDSPLGPFYYLPDSPFMKKTSGLIIGPGHGSIVEGPNGTLWAFYTCHVGNYHIFERRIGMDPIEITPDGRIVSRGASEVPQWAPGVLPNPAAGNDVGWKPITANKPARASSYSPGRTPNYAVDNSFTTWWEPLTNDTAPWLICHFLDLFNVYAVRIHWSETGLDYDNGALPGPVKYVIELSPNRDGENWIKVIDESTNTKDMLIDYKTFYAVSAYRIRVKIIEKPPRINTGILELTAFGLSPNNPPPE